MSRRGHESAHYWRNRCTQLETELANVETKTATALLAADHHRLVEDYRKLQAELFDTKRLVALIQRQHDGLVADYMTLMAQVGARPENIRVPA